MKTICMYFQVHQPFRFRRYRFFEIGTNHYYYDDYTNESILQRLAAKSYLPTNKILLDLIKEYGSKFKVAFSISGTALDQFNLYAPEVLESFQKLANTGCVEFLAETDSHSLSSLTNREEFELQVNLHAAKIEKYFKQKPTVFRNTELIYSNQIGNWVANLGYKAAITEGAKHILGWKSPNYLYCNAENPRLKLIFKNYRLADDITLRFSNHSWNEFPLTAEKYVAWLDNLDKKEDTVNLFINYDTFGSIQPKESGIFEFLKAFPKCVFSQSKLSFTKPSELVENLQPVAPISIPHAISWIDEERDTSAWLGNELQKEAFNKLYFLRDKVRQLTDVKILTDWRYLQTSDHFYYMNTKFFHQNSVQAYFNPYNSPYDAFINYMNILSDFEIRVNTETENTPKANEKKIKVEVEKKTKPANNVTTTKKTTKKIEKKEEQKILANKKVVAEKVTKKKDLNTELKKPKAKKKP